jgi:hypothetical protein
MNVVQEFLPGREGNDLTPEECKWKRDWVRDEGRTHLIVSPGRGLELVEKATRARALATSNEGKKLKWTITQAGYNFLSAWQYPEKPREEEVLAAIAARTPVKKSNKRKLDVIDEDGRGNKKDKKVEVFKTKTAGVPVLRQAVAATEGTPLSHLLDVRKEELLGRFVHITFLHFCAPFLHFCARHKHNSYIIYNVDVG